MVHEQWVVSMAALFFAWGCHCRYFRVLDEKMDRHDPWRAGRTAFISLCYRIFPLNLFYSGNQESNHLDVAVGRCISYD
jgi:hypothetical protein